MTAAGVMVDDTERETWSKESARNTTPRVNSQEVSPQAGRRLFGGPISTAARVGRRRSNRPRAFGKTRRRPFQVRTDLEHSSPGEPLDGPSTIEPVHRLGNSVATP